MNTPHPTPDTEGRIDCEVRGHVLLICINRPAKRNVRRGGSAGRHARVRCDAAAAFQVGGCGAGGEVVCEEAAGNICGAVEQSTLMN